METKIKVNNYDQAVKEVAELDKEKSLKIKEEINLKEKGYYHLLMITVETREGEAKNKVIVNPIIVNEDKFNKLKKNLKFLGFNKMIILHDPSKLSEEEKSETPIHPHDAIAIEAKVRAELEAKHKAEMDEMRKKLQEEAKAKNIEVTDEEVVVDPETFEAEFQEAISGKKEDLMKFIEKYGVNQEGLSNNEDRKNVIQSFYEAQMEIFETQKSSEEQ